MAIELDKDIASTMTDEELEAINADASPDELLVMRQQAEADKLDSDDEDEDDSDDGEVAAPEVAKPDEPAVIAEQPVVEAKAQEDFKPKFQSTLPDDFEAQVGALENEQQALGQAFDDGEIDRKAFAERTAELNKRRDSLAAEQIKADIFAEMNSQSDQQARAFAADRFAASVKAEVDYQNDQEKVEDFAMFARKIEAANANKTFEWVLQEAHRRVKVLHDIQNAAPAQKTLHDAKASRKPPSSVPQTLANVPGADGPGDVSGEFVDLDGMDGMDYETAIAKMTPAQRERYLKAA